MRLLTRLESLERKIALPGGQCNCNDAGSVLLSRIGSTHHLPTDPTLIASIDATPPVSRCPKCQRLRSQIIIQYEDRLPQMT